MIANEIAETSKQWIVFFVIVVATMCAMIASTGVIVATPSITGALALSSNQNIWISTGYLMMVASVVPLSTYAANCFGYKKVFIAGILIYAIFGTAVGLMDSYVPFLICRLISGIGVGLIFPVSLSILGQTFKHNGVEFVLAAYSAIGFGGGSMLGFLLGGFLSQYYQWNYVFFVDAIIGIPLAILAVYYFKEETSKPQGKFDFLGYFLFISFACSILMVLANAKAAWNTEGWDSWFIRFFIGLAIVSLIAFILEEYKKKEPLFHLSLFRIHSFTISCVLLFFIGGLFFSTASLFPILLINTIKYSKIQSAMHMLIYGFSVGMTGCCTSFLIKKIGEKVIILIGGIFLLTDVFMQHAFSIYSDHFFILTLLFFRGIGIGLTLGPLTAWAMRDVPDEFRSNGSTIVTIFRQMGAGMLGSLIELISYDRYRFHIERFFENFEFQRRGLTLFYRNLSRYDYLNYGENFGENEMRAKEILIDVIKRQANLLSLNDAFFILGIIMSALFFVTACLFVIEYFEEKIKKQNNF
jgi:DHA2 family multidrug resistance protein